MIGGCDMHVDVVPTKENVDLALRVIRSEWLDGVVELEDGSVVELKHIPSLAAAMCDEFFVYKNRAAETSWNEHGLTDTNQDQMIVVMLEDGFINFVVDADDSEAGKLVLDVLQAVQSNRPLEIAA